MGKTINKEKNAPEVINVSVNEEGQDLQNRQIQNRQIQNRQLQDQQIQDLQNRNMQIHDEENADLIPLEVNNVNIIGNQQDIIVAHENALRMVNSNMPDKYVANTANANKEVKATFRAELPVDMVALLDEIEGWKKVKQDTSIPVKKAAEELKKAKNDMDAAGAMAELAAACAHYMQINGSNIFKNKRRKQAVTELMSKISCFISNADPIYYNSFEDQVKLLKTKASDGKLEAKLKTFESELKDSLVSAIGVETIEEAEVIIRERQLRRVEAAKKEVKRLKGFSDLSDEEKAELKPYTDADRTELYDKLKKEQMKNMTEEQFRIYERTSNSGTILRCPEYNETYQKVASRFKTYGANGTYTRDAIVVLRPVNFDKNWKPVTKEDKANHEWNLRFLKAYENDDYATREEMLAEECPHTYDKVEFPPLPMDKIKKYMAAKKKAEELAKNKNANTVDAEKTKLENEINGLRKELQIVLEDWIDDFVRNGDFESFFVASQRGLAFDAMKKVHPSMAEFKKNNPLFEAKSDVIDRLTYYITLYSQFTLGMDIGQGSVKLKYFDDTEKGKKEREKLEKTNRKTMDEDLMDNLISMMFKIEELKNEGIKPYVKCGDIEAEKQRLAEIYRNKQEENEKNRQEAERKQRGREELAPKIQAVAEKLNANTAFGTKEDLEKILGSKLTGDQVKQIKANTKVSLVTDLKVAEKMSNAGIMTNEVDAVTDMKIRLRKAVPLELKKKIDYPSFENLSNVAAMFGDEQEAVELLKKLTGALGESKRLAADVKEFSYREKDGDKAGYYALDVLTAEMLKIDVSSYDVRSDKAIAQNAAALEKMARGVESCRKLIVSMGGEAYFKNLKNRNGDLFRKVSNQLSRLTLLSNYYRVKKAMMEDEYYIESEKPVSAEKNKDDIFEIDRLKRLQSLAEAYGMSLSIVGEKDVDYEPNVLNAFLEKDEGTIRRIEQERYQAAPKWMYNELSLSEQKEQNDDPDVPGIIAQAGARIDNYFIFEKIPKREGDSDGYKAVQAAQDKMKGKRFKESSVSFVGGTDKYLEYLHSSDAMSRSTTQHSFALNYRRTGKEMEEMLELLNIQNTEYWQTVKDDKEAVAYYESAYKEMSMREIESHYANVKRAANTVGLKMLVMHPVDLAMQYSYRLKLQMLGAFISTNIDTKDNMKRVEKLFKENNKDGRFLFDEKEFSALSGLVSMAGWKLGNAGRLISNVAMGKFDDEEDADGIPLNEVEEQVLGKTGIITNEIKGQTDKLQAGLNDLEEKVRQESDPGKLEAIEKEIRDIKEELRLIKLVGEGFYWLMKHPEVYNRKTFLKKGSNGKYIFGKELRWLGKNVYDQSANEIKYVLDNNLLKPLDKKELKEYETSLKKRKMPAYMIEGDIYGIDLYRKKLDGLIEKDKDGNPVKEDGEIKFKKIEDMPEIDSVTGKPMED